MNQKCLELLKETDQINTIESFSVWVRDIAGSSNTNYFSCNKSGDLKLQQIPDEYSNVLFELKSKSPKSYLEIGIGNGGSWLTCSYFLRESLDVSHAVDNLSYKDSVNQKIEEIEFSRDFLREHIKEVEFYNSDSRKFLDQCTRKYDVIFIDGDHSYEGVKRDFDGSINLINPGGLMVFHDIASSGAPGVVQFWNEIENKYPSKKFVYSHTCGMGIIYF